MKLSVPEFLDRYAASGLATRDSDSTSDTSAASQHQSASQHQPDDAPPAANAILKGFAAEHDGQQPSDVSQLARWMIQQGKLTRYQAERLVRSAHVSFRLGEFQLLQPLETPPFSGWWSAIDQQGSSVQLYVGSAETDSAAKERFQSHAAVDSPHLQPLSGPVVVSRGPKRDKSLLYISRLPTGATAADAVSDGGLSAARVVELGRQVCAALQALHLQGLRADIVDATRLWVAESGAAVLLRDPLADPATGQGSWFAPPEVAGRYRAPERWFGEARPDEASDVYALGCLLFQLRFGRPPMSATNDRELALQHARETPEEIVAAVRDPETAEPLLRVIAHAIAKNRTARFADVRQLEKALAVAAELMQKERVATAQAAAPAPAASPLPAEASAPANARAPADSVEAPVESASPIITEPAATTAPVIATEPVPASAPAVAVTPVAVTPRVSGSGVPLRRRRKKNKVAPLVLGGLGFLVMVLVIMLLVQPADTPSPPQQAERRVVAPPPLPAREPATAAATAGTSSGGGASVRLVDAPNVLWAAPTDGGTQADGGTRAGGGAPSLALLPPGAEMIISFRPDRLRETAAGQQLLRALEPELGEGLQHLESRLGVSLDQVQRLTLAVEGAGGGAATASLAAELAAPMAIDALRDRWRAEEAQTPDGQTVLVGEKSAGNVYYVPPAEQGQTQRFAVGSSDQMERVAETEGAPIPLARNLAQLWRGVGEDADLAVLISPNFLFADGRQILERYAPAAVDPLRRLLVPDATGVALRMDLAPQWYVELRLAPGGSISPTALANNVTARIAQLPSDAEQFLLNASPHRSWRALALRLPAMMRAVADTSRSGVVDGQAVVNLYLPAEAAPNVLVAGWLAVNTPAGVPSRPETAPTAMATAPQSIDEMLDRPLTVSFDQESLEFAAETIRDEFNAGLPPQSPKLKIVLKGGDLQLAGITQNQQIRDFDHRDSPLREVLDDLVRRANPDKTATRLDQPAQKLVWALGPDPDAPDRRAVLITIREKAESDYELPPQFKASEE